MEKLCYVLPRFDPATPTHFLHLYELLGRIDERVDLLLIYATDADTRPDLDAKLVRIPAAYRPIKAFRYLAAILTAYVRGYRTFYVHYHTLSSLWAGLLCRLFGGRTYVFCCVQHDRYFASWRPTWSNLKRKFLVDLSVRLSLRCAQRVVACSQYMETHISETLGVSPDRVRVFENWVNTDRYRPLPDLRASMRRRHHLPADALVVLFVHTLGEHKGAHLLPELAIRVAAACPDVHFLVAGEGPYRSQLAQEIRANNLGSQVHLIGPVPNRDVPELFAAADVFINPATVEEFGRVLLEAMACGVPFVSTDGDGGVLAFTTPRQQEHVTLPDDIGAFADRVVRLLRSPEERKSLAEEGLAHVRGYSLDVAAERFIDLIEDRAGGRSATA